MDVSELPSNLTLGAELGRGGGGEVWEVCDRRTGDRLAFKLLTEEASNEARAALVREAAALSALEGLGLPRVRAFGRLPKSGRAYLVRDLVPGRCLDDLIESKEAERALRALVQASEQLTVLHRSELLHGDLKPANIIVGDDGSATIVDLGLSARWRDGGARVEGLTPRYAAPELFRGGALTVRAEVYSLGATLLEILPLIQDKTRSPALQRVAACATAGEPGQRYPSADEFASALRAAAGLPPEDVARPRALEWPVLGIEGLAERLLEMARGLNVGERLVVHGPEGAGRSLLLQRLGWALSVEGYPATLVDSATASDAAELRAQLAQFEWSRGYLLIDDVDLIEPGVMRLVNEVTPQLRLVCVSSQRLTAAMSLEVPPLDPPVASELLRRALPAMSEKSLARAVRVSRGRPGALRKLARRLASDSVVSAVDVERILGATPSDVPRDCGSSDLERFARLIDRGRFRDASELVQSLESCSHQLEVAVALARWEFGMGQPGRARDRLEAVRALALAAPGMGAAAAWALYMARALTGCGEFAAALEQLSVCSAPEFEAESLTYRAQALSYLGRHVEAREALQQSVDIARSRGNARVEGLALASLGFVLQRLDQLEEAQASYRQAIDAAERADDASTLASAQLNLAGVLKIVGDIAGACAHYEAAIDTGRRSGRESTVRQAMLNLANLDVQLGRWARAQGSIDSLEKQADELLPMQRAQLLGLRAELTARNGTANVAADLYEASASVYESLGRVVDAAEARLEGVLMALEGGGSVFGLRRRLELAEAALGDAPAHRALFLVAKAGVARLGRDESSARDALDAAVHAARDAGQREWLWRALAARADLEDSTGQSMMSRHDREEAAAVLEAMAAPLPRDLREVYWNDPRRRRLVDRVRSVVAAQPPRILAGNMEFAEDHTAATSTVLEQRLARILEINAELVGELDLDRLAGRITDHAVRLLRAERGFLLLLADDGELKVYARRLAPGDDEHVAFSRSVAERVISSGEPLVSTCAGDDVRMAGYASVHQLMLKSLACVPIRSPSGSAIGALYLETRLRVGVQFEKELPMLQAFSDQMAIAIENVRLIAENRRRAEELAGANRELAAAQQRLEKLLDNRTQRLHQARQELRETRGVLYGHFGYHGIVGTSQAMRSVYSLIDRVKDTDVPVLITGESGTGKEVVARAIHEASQRKRAKFVAVNCGAVPEQLLESELFGSIKGAFTGADRDRKGLFREAAEGTILLDEIGEMPHRMQAGMLRVLQDGKVRPVGGTREEAVDVRIVFATHRDLEALVQAGQFREDLYYRIHVVGVHLPPLRERVEDIPQLVDHFLGRFATRYRREKRSVSRAALRMLMGYHWPGNVRQLEHVLLNAWVLTDQPELEVEDFELPRQSSSELPPPSPLPSEPSDSTSSSPQKVASIRNARSQPRSALSRHRGDEKERILAALEECNWNRVKAAELVGMPRRTFYRRLKRHGIQ